MDGEFIPAKKDEESVMAYFEELGKMKITDRELNELWSLVYRRILFIDSRYCGQFCLRNGEFMHTCFRKNLNNCLWEIQWLMFYFYSDQSIQDLNYKHFINDDVAQYLRWISRKTEFCQKFKYLLKLYSNKIKN